MSSATDQSTESSDSINQLRKRWQSVQYRFDPFAEYAFLIPPMLVLLVVLGIPVVFNLYASFFNWNGAGMPTDFVGLENYFQLLNDPTVIRSIVNTAVWTVGMATIPLFVGLGFALLIDGLRGRVLFKTIVFLPYVISFVAVALMWRLMYHSSEGIVNTALIAIGLEQFTKAWLGVPWVNTFAMMVTQGWLFSAFAFIIYFAGLQSIPKNLIEAGKVDGLGPLQRIRHIKVPLLRPFTTVILATILINVLKIFDIIWVMTEGGPHFTSETLAVTMYRLAFSQFRFGDGAAAANILTLLVVVVVVLYIRRNIKKEIEYQ